MVNGAPRGPYWVRSQSSQFVPRSCRTLRKRLLATKKIGSYVRFVIASGAKQSRTLDIFDMGLREQIGVNGPNIFLILFASSQRNCRFSFVRSLKVTSSTLSEKPSCAPVNSFRCASCPSPSAFPCLRNKSFPDVTRGLSQPIRYLGFKDQAL